MRHPSEHETEIAAEAIFEIESSVGSYAGLNAHAKARYREMARAGILAFLRLQPEQR